MFGRRKWLAVMVVAVALVAGMAPATSAKEAKDRAGRWGLGLETGMWKRTGGDLDYSNLDQFAAFMVNRGLAEDWNLQVALRYGYTRSGVAQTGEDAGWSTSTGAALYTPTWQPSIKLQRRFALSESVTPFLGAGIGLMSWKVVDKINEEGDVGLMPDGEPVLGFNESGEPVELSATNLALTGEIGLEIALGEAWALNGGARLHWAPNDLDNVGLSSRWGPEDVDANTMAVDFFLGATLWFGADTDRDGDSIPNSSDACPDQAEDVDGFQDTDGCPDLDNDGDGVPDLRDDCPGQAEDLDGYEDDDGCPDPDNDGDGVIDARDGCPDQAEDRDGFEDADGCPDLDDDGDGVLDTEDRCPGTSADVPVDEFGCEIVVSIPEPAVETEPVPAPGQTVIMELAGFASGSARLLPGSEVYLDRWARTLRDDPAIRIEVRGHTDSQGSSEINRDLSQRRASHVRDELIRRGASPLQITAVGYGEDKPLTTNETRDGRARNRRVGLHRVR